MAFRYCRIYVYMGICALPDTVVGEVSVALLVIWHHLFRSFNPWFWLYVIMLLWMFLLLLFVFLSFFLQIVKLRYIFKRNFSWMCSEKWFICCTKWWKWFENRELIRYLLLIDRMMFKPAINSITWWRIGTYKNETENRHTVRLPKVYEIYKWRKRILEMKNVLEECY